MFGAVFVGITMNLIWCARYMSLLNAKTSHARVMCLLGCHSCMLHAAIVCIPGSVDEGDRSRRWRLRTCKCRLQCITPAIGFCPLPWLCVGSAGRETILCNLAIVLYPQRQHVPLQRRGRVGGRPQPFCRYPKDFAVNVCGYPPAKGFTLLPRVAREQQTIKPQNVTRHHRRAG